MQRVLGAATPFLASAVCPGLHMGTPPSNMAEIPHSHKYDQDLRRLDMGAVEQDVMDLMLNSQECWPADWDNYGPFFIRLAWHCSGSFRNTDGRGGCSGGRQRFEPERSWDDNTNLDKARALLWPIKEKYGDGLSWGDLFTFAGTTAIKSMGGPTLPFCFGRIDDADGTESLELGPTPEQEADIPCAVDGKCEKPLGTTTLGLIYLNPEGPMGVPDPVGSAANVRDAFARMGMNDTQTVALIGGGHAFGKTHGACPAGPGGFNASSPDGPWPGDCGTGKGADTFTSGFEGPWTTEPTKWDNEFFRVMVDNQWEKIKGPGGHWQWRVTDRASPYANVMRLTSDIALLHDESFAKISHDFASDQSQLDVAFAQAWDQLVNAGGIWSREKKCHGLSSMVV